MGSPEVPKTSRNNELVYVVEPPNPAKFEPIIYSDPQLEPGIYKATVEDGDIAPLVNVRIIETTFDLTKWKGRAVCTVKAKVFTPDALCRALSTFWARGKEPANPIPLVNRMFSHPDHNLILAEVLAAVALKRVAEQSALFGSQACSFPLK